MDHVTWVSGCSTASCIEVAEFPSGSVQIRLTGNPDDRLFPSRAGWDAFLKAAKEGKFDDLDPVL